MRTTYLIAPVVVWMLLLSSLLILYDADYSGSSDSDDGWNVLEVNDEYMVFEYGGLTFRQYSDGKIKMISTAEMHLRIHTNILDDNTFDS